MAMSVCSAFMTTPPPGLETSPAAGSCTASTRVPRPSADVGFAQTQTDKHRALCQGDLLEQQLGLPGVHHDVEEVGHPRPAHERGDARPADVLRVDDPIGAGAQQLAEAVVLASPRHDEQVGTQ